MKYTEWLKHNPGAPRNLHELRIAGAVCEMTQTIRNGAGAKIRRGTRVTVYNGWGGRFYVRTSGGTEITFVSPALVKYVGPKRKGDRG